MFAESAVVEHNGWTYVEKIPWKKKLILKVNVSLLTRLPDFRVGSLLLFIILSLNICTITLACARQFKTFARSTSLSFALAKSTQTSFYLSNKMLRQCEQWIYFSLSIPNSDRRRCWCEVFFFYPPAIWQINHIVQSDERRTELYPVCTRRKKHYLNFVTM